MYYMFRINSQTAAMKSKKVFSWYKMMLQVYILRKEQIKKF